MPRGLSGMEEVPVLKELNDIRQLIADETGVAPDFSVLDKDTFMSQVDGMLSDGKYSARDIEDAYLQLHLITELGGSHAPIANVSVHPSEVKNKNYGKLDIEYTFLPKDHQRRIVDDTRSREHTAQAFLEGWKMRPTITNPEHLADTADMLSRFVTTNSQDKIANTGFRNKKGRGSSDFQTALVQNWNDHSGGYDRLTRDYIVNQEREFGHDIAFESGGSDTSDNGRMQAKGANRAAADKLGVFGSMRVLGPGYTKNKKRMAGDVLASYNNYLVP